MAETPDNQDDAKPADAGVLTRALANFDSCITAVQEERALALRDRRFATIAGAQWEGDWAEQFANSIMVEVNKTAQGVEKIEGHYRKNRVIVNFRGVGKGSDEDTADTLDGMFRADLNNSKGQQAFDNAFSEAVLGGFGAWRLVNNWEDELDPDNDHQRIFFETIVDADQSVFFDPNAKLYDKSDADWCVVITAVALAAFKKKWAGKFDGTGPWPDGLFKPFYDWYTPDVVKIAEYYEVVQKEGLLRILQHAATGEERREWAADLSSEDFADLQTEGWRQVRTRRAKRRQVLKWTLSGADVLSGPQIVAGEMIPVIPVYGKRWFIDNMERSCGHVRRAVDPQRIYNAQISKLTETSALAPLERPIVTPEQIQGHENSWAEANINRAPYALLNPMLDTNGNPMPAAPIGSISPPQLSPVLAALIQITANDIAELTSADDGADQVMSNVSADAMDIAATRTDDKAEIYVDNFKQSMQRCGEVYQSMSRDVYFEEGREVETLSADGKSLGTAVLGEAVTDDQGRFSIRNDLSRGKYKVIADVSEKTATRRDKTVKTLTSAAAVSQQTDPELASACINTALLNMDGEGIADLQEWIRKRLVGQGVVKPTEEEQAQMEQAAQEQQPDPQAQALQAMAAKDQALGAKAEADTELSKAKTVETLARAKQINADAEHAPVEKKLGVMERMRSMFAPKDAA